MSEQFKVKWIDRGQEPRCPPNPEYPNGIDLDASGGCTPACTAPLPYPAKRIGYYAIDCALCGGKFMCTTAGRADDPCSIKVPCILPKQNKEPVH